MVHYCSWQEVGYIRCKSFTSAGLRFGWGLGLTPTVTKLLENVDNFHSRLTVWQSWLQSTIVSGARSLSLTVELPNYTWSLHLTSCPRSLCFLHWLHPIILSITFLYTCCSLSLHHSLSFSSPVLLEHLTHCTVFLYIETEACFHKQDIRVFHYEEILYVY